MRILLKDGSGAVDLRYLLADSDRHGTTRLYFRRKGFKKVRLREIVGTEAFMAAYRAALKTTEDKQPAKPSRSAPGRTTIGWLIETYKGSKAFGMLDVETQKARRRHLDWLSETRGTRRFKKMRPRHVRALIEKRSDTPHGANNLLKTLRGLFKWALKEELIETNPAREVEKLEAATDGFHTWTVSEILKFIERHPADTKAGLTFALLFYLGVRRSDVVKLGRQMEDGDILRIVETKGRRRKVKVTELTILPELRAVLDLHPSDNLTYLTTMYGAPFTAKGFGGWFKDRCREAGLGHCSAHGVRKGGATIIADKGGTEHELMAMYSWANPAQAAVYTRKANRKKLAARASKLLSLEDQKPNISDPPLPPMAEKK